MALGRIFHGLKYSWKATNTKSLNMEQVLPSYGQEVPCYFLTGRAARAWKTVSAPDFTPLNTEGATLPIFSVKG